jgi:hypothetical protein
MGGGKLSSLERAGTKLPVTMGHEIRMPLPTFALKVLQISGSYVGSLNDPARAGGGPGGTAALKPEAAARS